MSPASIKASSLYSEAKMVDCTKVKFDVPIGTWGQTQVEVEYPWHRDLDSIILPLLETAHEQQAERQRKHRSAEGQPVHKSHSKKSRSVAKAEIVEQTLPMRPNEDIKLYLKGFESARDLTTKRGETFQNVLELYAQQAEKDVERLELFYKGKHAGRGMTPDTGLKTVRSCKSTSSLDSSTTSTQSRERRRRTKQRTVPQEELERGSILVANDTGIETDSSRLGMYTVPVVPEKSPLRYSHYRPGSWESVDSASSDKALKLLGIDTNELQHHLEQIDSVIPLQHFASGAVTQVDLQPGPSRLARQHPRQTSIVSDKAFDVLGMTTEEQLHQLDQQISDEISSLHDSLSPIERRHTQDQHNRTVSMTSSMKARRMLGVDRPDSDPSSGGRPASTHADYAVKTRSYPPALPKSYYPTSTTSYAHPEPLTCKLRGSNLGRTNAVAYRRRSALVGLPYEEATARKQPDTDRKRASGIVVPFAEPDERISDDVKLTTTCSGPVITVEPPADGEPEHTIRFKIRGRVMRRCPRMSGIIENRATRRSRSA
ncbi:hypothetical protein Slin15195_G110190 [Septoria linicola]|uniref:Uncharacterized protein n=1 Tax=Septoria linicola TaxID=215465 RepID=A0A9Q9B3T9_9PEZI|nr:hypothetical protein Slin15195_G110190 [Septoria linicola]